MNEAIPIHFFPPVLTDIHPFYISYQTVSLQKRENAIGGAGIGLRLIPLVDFSLANLVPFVQ